MDYIYGKHGLGGALIKMLFLDYLYNVPNATSGLDEILVETATEISILVPLLLFFVYFVVFLGGVSLQSARIGKADYPMWSVVASLSITILSLIISIIEGLMRLDWLVIVVVVTIFSAVWLFLDRQQGEV